MGDISGFYERRDKTLGSFGGGWLFPANGSGSTGIVAATVEPRAKTPCQQDRNHCRILQRFANIGFHEPVVVDYTSDGAEVDCAVEHLPAAAAEAANPAGCGGDGERNHEHKTGEADGDEGALGDVFQHFGPIEVAIEPEPSGEMQAGVEKREKAEHAAEADELRQLQDLAERRDGERENQEAQRPIAGPVFDELNGVGGQIVVQAAPDENCEREEAGQEYEGLRPFAGED